MNIVDILILIALLLGIAMMGALYLTQQQQIERRAGVLKQCYASAIDRGDAMVVLPNRINTLKKMVYVASATALAVLSYALSFAWLIDQVNQCVMTREAISVLFSLIFFGWMMVWLGYLSWSYCHAKRKWMAGEYYPPLRQLPWFKPAIRVKQTAATKQRAISQSINNIMITTAIMLLIAPELRSAISPIPIRLTYANIQSYYATQCVIPTQRYQDMRHP
jgi:hypothetical protein